MADTPKIDKLEVEYDNVYGAKVDAKFGVVAATAGYTVFQDAALNGYEYVNVGVAFDVAKNLNLSANYMKSSEKYVTDDDDAIVVGLSYAGAKAAKAGSFGIYANYYDQARSTVVAHTMNGEYGTHGFKGYMVGANYTFAKNIVGAVEYYDLEDKWNSNDLKTLWSQLVFTF